MTCRAALAIVATLLAAGIVLPARADAPATSQTQELAALRERIQALEQNLNQTRGQRDSVRDRLQDVERQIGDLMSGLRTLDAQLRAENRRLARLEVSRDQAQVQLQKQAAALAGEIQATFAMGRQPYLKLLLNQEDPAALDRALIYYRYLQRAHTERIQALDHSVSRLDRLQQDVTRRRRQLAALRQTQATRKQELERSQAQRRQLLAALDRRVVSQSAEIERLRQDAQRLGRLVKALPGYLAPSETTAGPPGDFADFRGRLPLPAAGRIIARYGSPRRGDLRWQGIFIAGKEGENVTAVFRGRVAFAGWLRGFGLLLILEHGDGYMTLYAHNQSLYKQVGDWVEAGQVIASMGSTGDTSGPGLYFEIRHDGKPTNPLRWCRYP